jgi:CRISP-associated protein Cas1
MIKRTLYFGNPAYLSKQNEQLRIKNPSDKDEERCAQKMNTVPIEDIGIIILDHPQITVTQALISSLLDNNAGIIVADSSHMPNGLFLPLSSNQLQSAKFQAQISASEPLKKQLWQQTITSKIKNQSAVIRQRGTPVTNMNTWIKKVRSGDPDNYEGRAAAYYWKNIFRMLPGFIRDRFGEPPNNLLNYGYAVLRAVTARSLVGSGLLPTLGIHHKNQYNSYCLADDIMEPYRPFVDMIVRTLVENGEDFYNLTHSVKSQLLAIATQEVVIDEERSPLMVGIQKTTASLSRCFEGESRKILYPQIGCSE